MKKHKVLEKLDSVFETGYDVFIIFSFLTTVFTVIGGTIFSFFGLTYLAFSYPGIVVIIAKTIIAVIAVWILFGVVWHVTKKRRAR